MLTQFLVHTEHGNSNDTANFRPETPKHELRLLACVAGICRPAGMVESDGDRYPLGPVYPWRLTVRVRGDG